LCGKFNNKSIVDRDSWGLWDIFQVFETAWESCNRNNNKNGEKKRLWDWEQVGIFGNFWEFLGIFVVVVLGKKNFCPSWKS
jgi:hypothetical protein